MATMTYYVSLAFKRSEEGGEIVACDPKEARSAEQAIRMATSLTASEGHWGLSYPLIFSRAKIQLEVGASLQHLSYDES
jgi:hypothetical protein